MRGIIFFEKLIRRAEQFFEFPLADDGQNYWGYLRRRAAVLLVLSDGHGRWLALLGHRLWLRVGVSAGLPGPSRGLVQTIVW